MAFFYPILRTLLYTIEEKETKELKVWDTNKRVLAIFFAIVAAALYAISIPLSKMLLQHIPPTMMASSLYFGAGIGIGIVFLLTKGKDKKVYEQITKKDMPYVVGMIVLDVAAPILLMFGLLDSASSNASLLNNFEIVCTSLIALLVFKEAVSTRMWLAISLITASSFVLSLEGPVLLQILVGSDTCFACDSLLGT